MDSECGAQLIRMPSRSTATLSLRTHFLINPGSCPNNCQSWNIRCLWHLRMPIIRRTSAPYVVNPHVSQCPHNVPHSLSFLGSRLTTAIQYIIGELLEKLIFHIASSIHFLHSSYHLNINGSARGFWFCRDIPSGSLQPQPLGLTLVLSPHV